MVNKKTFTYKGKEYPILKDVKSGRNFITVNGMTIFIATMKSTLNETATAANVGKK